MSTPLKKFTKHDRIWRTIIQFGQYREDFNDHDLHKLCTITIWQISLQLHRTCLLLIENLKDLVFVVSDVNVVVVFVRYGMR